MWKYRLLTYLGLYVISFSLIVAIFGEKGIVVNNAYEVALAEKQLEIEKRERELEILSAHISYLSESGMAGDFKGADWRDGTGMVDDLDKEYFKGLPLWASFLLGFVVPTLYLVLSSLYVRKKSRVVQVSRRVSDAYH